MTRARLEPDEAKRRIRECQKRYWEAHRDEILERQRAARMADPEAYRARRREAYRASMNKLSQAGVYAPVP